MQADLRAFLQLLTEQDRLLRLTKPVDPYTEVGALLLEAQRHHKAVLFESVKGSTIPCVGNIVGGRDLLALGLGVQPHEVVAHFLARSRERIAPVLVADGPVQEVVKTGDAVNLEELPLVVYSEKDAGRYITAGLVIAKDPRSGERNISFNRMMLRTGNEVGIRMMPPQHLGQIYDHAAARGQNLEVAVALGNHPTELVAAATTIPYGDDEFALAGALRGEPLELVRCRTVDLEVPANAEIILEGEVLANVAEPEGPYGDFMQFYVPIMDNRVLRIKAITHRRNPIYQAMHAGVLEDMTLLAVSREAQLYEALMLAGADLREVSLLPNILGAAISIRKRFEGEPKLLLAAAFGRYRWLKFCVIVDEDVDVLDISDVWWAIVTRSRLQTGTLTIDDTSGFPRDPFGLHVGKVGIDATIPLGSWDEHERKRTPQQGKLNLNDYL